MGQVVDFQVSPSYQRIKEVTTIIEESGCVGAVGGDSFACPYRR